MYGIDSLKKRKNFRVNNFKTDVILFKLQTEQPNALFFYEQPNMSCVDINFHNLVRQEYWVLTES